jgi:ketosteroid isomerase-like protein
VSLIAPQIAVANFVSRINAHDVRGIVAGCTPDHVFIDSLGTRLSCLAELERGWAGYFSLFPDYKIEIETMASAESLVLMTGIASATHRPSGISWRITAAWRALMAEHLIAEWQVYADNKPVYDILNARA